MANAVTEVRKLPGLRSIKVQGTIQLSGNYATGGETLALPKPGTTKDPYTVDVRSRTGAVVVYNPATQKLQAFTAAGTEHTAAAYGAAWTSAPLDYEAEYPKFG